jgi:hypothetical protein
MYNTKFACTYNTSELFNDVEDVDNITDEDKNIVRDSIYRYELLDIFGIKEYNETEINKCINKLYERVKESNELTECMIKLAGHFLSEDKKFGLMILFAYDYMYLSHICISEYLETGKISDINMWKLKSAVF